MLKSMMIWLGVSLLFLNSILSQAQVATTLPEELKAVQPRIQGATPVCYEIDLPIKKIICNYIPKYEHPANLQSRILRVFFGNRQPANPEESYVTVLNNGQLEFAHTNPDLIERIKGKLKDFDALDVFVQRRKLNVAVRILQLNENADQTLGFLATAQYAGKTGQGVLTKDRFSVTEAVGSILNVKFALGNLVNTLLEVALHNFESNNYIKTLSYFPISNVTHGYSFSGLEPYRVNLYIPTTSVSVEKESVGIRFDGEVRMFENMPNQIQIKNFLVSLAQEMPSNGSNKLGPEVFKAGPMDLNLELGCASAIRVLKTVQMQNNRERNFLFGRKKEEKEVQKDFLFVIQAFDQSVQDPSQLQNSNPPSCEQTKVLPAQ